MTVSPNKQRVNTMETIGRNIFQLFSQHNIYCQQGSLVKKTENLVKVKWKDEVWSQTVWLWIWFLSLPIWGNSEKLFSLSLCFLICKIGIKYLFHKLPGGLAVSYVKSLTQCLIQEYNIDILAILLFYLFLNVPRKLHIFKNVTSLNVFDKNREVACW